MNPIAKALSPVQQYAVVTANYWAFTLTDGALRMLVVLYFYSLGYGALAVAMLFLFYEFFGVVTNLVGGWLGARLGLNRTMQFGLGLQVVALLMLTLPDPYLSVLWVMAAQALSGIAKDLNKMSAKSSIKTLISDQQQGKLYQWIAALTGSKNALKGVGFFMGGLLLSLFGFQQSMWIMAIGLVLVLLLCLLLLAGDLGKAKHKAKFSDIFSKDQRINRLAGARLFLFAARDVWFVVALPVYFASQLQWPHWQVGSFMAAWVIGYGLVQGLAPKLVKQDASANGQGLWFWAGSLALLPLLMAGLLWWDQELQWAAWVLVIGLMLFGLAFAINSALHSYLIVAYARADGVSMDVGFYYMANAMGRLAGTLLSGWAYQVWGLEVCLLVSALCLLMAGLIARPLPRP